jgi:hypothetical protein
LAASVRPHERMVRAENQRLCRAPGEARRRGRADILGSHLRWREACCLLERRRQRAGRRGGAPNSGPEIVRLRYGYVGKRDYGNRHKGEHPGRRRPATAASTAALWLWRERIRQRSTLIIGNSSKNLSLPIMRAQP